MKIYHAIVLATLVAMLAAVGCGPSAGGSLAKVSGVITVDKVPTAGLMVTFYPKGEGKTASGVTDAEGKYTLTTLEPNDGAIVGQHEVTVTVSPVAGAGAGPPPMPGMPGYDAAKVATEPFHPKYKQQTTSGLTATVESGKDNNIPFDLEKAP